MSRFLRRQRTEDDDDHEDESNMTLNTYRRVQRHEATGPRRHLSFLGRDTSQTGWEERFARRVTCKPEYGKKYPLNPIMENRPCN